MQTHDINNVIKHTPQNKVHTKHKKKKASLMSKIIKDSIYFLFGMTFITSAVFIVWMTQLSLPDFNNFENRKIANSTKIYDRTGEVVLYNVHDNIKRTQVKSEEISDKIKRATVAIEDSNFYNHFGISPKGIIRAVFYNLIGSQYTQGGSTITQQVIKNSLLSSERTIMRKLKEWVLAIKLDSQLSKDEILTIYLNESPYGGVIYGVEEASLSYFGKHAQDVTWAEAAYLASMPQAPSRFSPFKEDISALEKRKNLVLDQLLVNKMIAEDEYNSAKEEKVAFKKSEDSTGKALHFVFYVRNILENKYGEDMVENGGLKVISTLDYDIQKSSEEILKAGAISNEAKFGARNSALVALDPKTGQILSMVGSRDYFDESIDGSYNVATAKRQPGSAFKPFVYILAFMNGLTPDTIIWDVPTQFSTTCPYDVSDPRVDSDKSCYAPVNYDGTFSGPINLRHALLWSLNIPAVKLQYIVGISDTLSFVKKFGFTTFGKTSDYGLSFALGAGEVSLLELTNAYGVLANNGIYNKPVAILEVYDKEGNLLEKYQNEGEQVVEKKYTDMISNVLIDSKSRYPAYSVNNPINYYDRQVAVKTGTTNDYKDVWVVGYTPSLVLGMWGGNNDNAPVTRTAGTVLSPSWRKSMDAALTKYPIEYFDTPTYPENIPAYLSGSTCINGQAQPLVYYLNGPSDPQYNLWNNPIQKWNNEKGVCYSQPQNSNPNNNSTTTPINTNTTNNSTSTN